jgi:hypothetical protein
MLANISQLILPTYNLVEMFKDQEASLQEPHKEKTVKAIRKSTKKQA